MKIINLLPKIRQQELYYDALLRTAWVVVCLSLASFALVFLAQFGTKFYLQLQAEAIKSQIVELQKEVGKQENSDVKAKIVLINNLIADYKNLADSSPKLSRVIKAFVPLPPAGVRINSFSIDLAQKSIFIQGQSPTRDLAVQLYNNILQDKQDFYNIDYPLENVAQPTNVNFHFTFYIQDKLMQ